MPASAQARMLYAQKHPKDAPQAFKTPYYQQALSGIRNFYRGGNDSSQLALATSKIESIKQEARREHNLRILNSFKLSELYGRKFELGTAKTFSRTVDDVELKLSPDLKGLEAGTDRIVLLNLRSQPLNPALAKTTLELVHWLIEPLSPSVTYDSIEYVDLFKNTSYRIKSRRASTIADAKDNLKIIKALWPTL